MLPNIGRLCHLSTLSWSFEYHIEVETQWTPVCRRYFKCIFLNENGWFSPTISPNFVPDARFNNIREWVQTMAWHRPDETPLYEPMVVSLLTNICVTRPQWDSGIYFSKPFTITCRAKLPNHVHIVSRCRVCSMHISGTRVSTSACTFYCTYIQWCCR